MARDDPMRPEPFRIQPDPARQFFVQPKADRLVRRGRRDWLIVWTTPTGGRAETRLGAMTFRMEGT